MNGEYMALPYIGDNRKYPVHPVHPVPGTWKPDWLQRSFKPTPPGPINHRRAGCRSTDRWEHIWGGAYCAVCFPPTEQEFVKQGLTTNRYQ